MTDYTLPVVPYSQSFWLQPHVGRSESPFTRQQKIYELSAPRWATRLSFRGGYDNAGGLRDVGGKVDALIAQLNGGANRLLVYDYRRSTRTGSGETLEDSGLVGTLDGFTDGTVFDDGFGFIVTWAGGPPVSVAALAGAVTMKWNGFAALGEAFKPGDYVGGDGRAHIVTEAATAAGDGSATVTFKPPLAADVAAGDGIFEEVTSPFRLVSDDAGSNQVEVGAAVVYDFELVEDI